MEKSTKNIIVIVLVLVILFLVFYIPVQRILAGIKYDFYIGQEEIDETDIITKEFSKNFKDGGYDIKVKYKDNPEKVYIYRYYPYIDDGELKFHQLILNNE